MPSTYSPLKIELPATGEQSGTWGNTTNTNLGTALEEAITGSANVTFSSGNVVLTLTDTNASQVARNLRLNLIGVTGGSTRTLTVPAIKKLYLVSNNCADSVIVGNSTGATVTVPAGNNIFVYNDGTDVLNAITYLTSLNALTVDTTNLEVTNIKAKDGTASATIADSTGVMTVGSSVLTTTDINGGTIDATTIGGASAAAGNFTTLGASGVATFSAGSVSAPAITTTGDTNTGIFFPAADTIAFTEGGVEAMRINASGQVGIGTNDPSAGILTLSNTGAGTCRVQLNGTTNYSIFQAKNTSGDFYFGIDNSAGSGFNAGAYGRILYSGGAYPMLFYTNDAERMRIDSSGNVGIGTSSPAQKLSVQGTGRFALDLTLEANLVLPSGSTIYNSSGDIFLRAGTSGALRFGSGNTNDRMILDSSGNVGIGTSTAGRMLTVAPVPFAAGNLGGIRLINTSNNATSMFEVLYGLESGTGIPFGSLRTGNDGNAYISFFTGSGPAERMRIDSSGNVGINTTDTSLGGLVGPAKLATVVAAGNSNIALDGYGDAIGFGIAMRQSGSAAGGLGWAMYYFNSSNAFVGGIRTTTTATTYQTASDYRLKTVIGAVSDAGQRIDLLEPIEYDWKSGGRTRGFLAHKFAEVYPNSVSGKKDAIDKNGKPIYQAMQASSPEVIADLIAEIQSLRKRVAQLESK
jgi:hypothetical protein